MVDKCFAIYYFCDNEEIIIYNLSQFNIFSAPWGAKLNALADNLTAPWGAKLDALASNFSKSKVKELIRASAKEIYDRITENCDLDITLNLNKKFSLVGSKQLENACFLFTTEPMPHNHLLLLSKLILFHGIKDTIEDNFEYIKTQMKCKHLQKELAEIKTIMINNIDLLLKRGEKLEDLLIKTEYLTDTSKKFYENSKKLNKCCWIF